MQENEMNEENGIVGWMQNERWNEEEWNEWGKWYLRMNAK